MIEAIKHPSLRGKGLIIIVGPSGVGKSAIIRHICEQDPSITAPVGFTTRDPRPDDKPNAYNFISHTDYEHISSGDIVQSIVHPDGNIYGTLVSDYTSQVSVVDAMTESVADFRTAGFRSIRVFGIIASADEWFRRFELRFPNEDESRQYRLFEALRCLLWLDENPEATLIINDAPTNKPAAEEILRHIIQPTYGDGQKTARSILTGNIAAIRQRIN